jgi:hypothetical protein
VERPRPAMGNGRDGARNRWLARLPKPALVSNRKVLRSIGAFLRTVCAPGANKCVWNCKPDRFSGLEIDYHLDPRAPSHETFVT